MLALQSTKPIVVVNAPAGTGRKPRSRRHEAMRYQRIALTRPTVAADEDLGYFPRTVIRNSRALDAPPCSTFSKNTCRDLRWTAPCASSLSGFFAGGHLSDTFILADEMQNSTRSQMQLLLTRLGPECKLVVTGDLHQSDVGPENGLADLLRRIDGLDLAHVETIEMTQADILRSDAVRKILTVYGLKV